MRHKPLDIYHPNCLGMPSLRTDLAFFTLAGKKILEEVSRMFVDNMIRSGFDELQFKYM